MALIKSETSKLPHWNIRESSCVRHQLPKIVKTPEIDYDNLQLLCNIPGLTLSDDASDKEAHARFMQTYKQIFAHKLSKTKFSVPTKSVHTFRMNAGELQGMGKQLALISKPDNKLARKVNSKTAHSGTIRELCNVLPSQRKKEEHKSTRKATISTLRHILRKSPLERTTSDNDQIFSILQTFDFFVNNVDPAVLKLLSSVACLEVWKDVNFYVYGKTGVHMVLKGSVTPVLKPYTLADGEGVYPKPSVSFGESSEEDASQVRLFPGDCFGSWFQCEEPYTKDLSVLTAEPNCEFMKISAANYQHVITQMKHKEQTEKLNLLMSCDQYKTWPRQPLLSVAACIEWVSFPPNTVLVSEGNKSPFIGFIQSGKCALLRKLLVRRNSQTGQTEKQVVMGELGQHDSFAEISCLLDESVSCSIVTTTHVRLGIIQPEKAKGLDEVTRQLMVQSSSRNMEHLTMEDIQNEYLQQEQRRKWNAFKQEQVLKVVKGQGSRHKLGTWAK
ncbi:unnamed protein product [Candidula unifasciata]|uniref:Cyclic nucleotide-binding domain-containing protein n=1 Tax=Candidula unifasciata TaxID=100452 RepID=A0A8S3ZPY5_9EUPU|nr:unnamed protein product [Candidula unifasciata]